MEPSTSSQKPRTTILFDDLPIEIFQLILQFLLFKGNWNYCFQLRRLSTKWRDNIDYILSQRKTLHFFGTNKVVAYNRPKLNYKIFEKLLDFHPNLEELSLKDYQIENKLMTILVEKVPNLKKLIMKNLKGYLTWRAYFDLGEGMKNLETIVIDNCDIDETCLNIIVDCIRKLTNLSILNPGRQVSFKSLRFLPPTIKKIYINSISCNFSKVSKYIIEGNGKNIEELLVFIHFYNDINWDYVTNNLKNLKTLKLNFHSHGASVLNEIRKFKNLENLSLTENAQWMNESILTDISLIPLLMSLKKLKHLSLAGTDTRAVRATNLTFKQIYNFCPNIEEICFFNVINVNNETIFSLSKCRKLKSLEIYNSVNITSLSFRTLLSYGSSIEKVKLENCININENIINCFKDFAGGPRKRKLKLILGGVDVTINVNDLPKYLTVELI